MKFLILLIILLGMGTTVSVFAVGENIFTINSVEKTPEQVTPELHVFYDRLNQTITYPFYGEKLISTPLTLYQIMYSETDFIEIPFTDTPFDEIQLFHERWGGNTVFSSSTTINAWTYKLPSVNNFTDVVLDVEDDYCSNMMNWGHPPCSDTNNFIEFSSSTTVTTTTLTDVYCDEDGTCTGLKVLVGDPPSAWDFNLPSYVIISDNLMIFDNPDSDSVTRSELSNSTDDIVTVRTSDDGTSYSVVISEDIKISDSVEVNLVDNNTIVETVADYDGVEIIESTNDSNIISSMIADDVSNASCLPSWFSMIIVWYDEGLISSNDVDNVITWLGC